MTDWPKISIITVVKNGAATLEKAIESLLSQNYPNLEYIVMDGASTDDTLNIIKKYQKHISYFESEDDRNCVLAQKRGMAKITGEIFSILNADDFYEPGILEKVGREFANDPQLDIVSTRYRIVKFNEENELKAVFESKAVDMELEHGKNLKIFAPNARFFKRDLFLKYNFPTVVDDQGRAFIGNDAEYMIRFVIDGVKSKIIDCVGYNYLAHDDSLTFSGDIKSRKRLAEDRIFIAKKFLAVEDKKITAFWRKKLKKWITKYRTQIAVINLRERNWSQLKINLKNGVRESGIFKFVFVFLKKLIRNK